MKSILTPYLQIETKKKLLQALKGVNVEEEDVSLYTTRG